MKINDRYEIRVVVIELHNGTTGNVYDNFEEFKKEHPFSSYKFGYIVFDTEYGYVPDNCNDWNDSPEEAMMDYEGNCIEEQNFDAEYIIEIYDCSDLEQYCDFENGDELLVKVKCDAFGLDEKFKELLKEYEGQKYRIINIIKDDVVISGAMDPNDIDVVHEEVREKETEMWYKFYMTFNDDNLRHADNAFHNNGLSEATVAEIHAENVKWFKEIMEHGTSAEEICSIMPEAKVYKEEIVS